MRAAVGVGLLVTACTPHGTRDAAVVVRDSAGIRIVESRQAAWGDRPAWRVVEPPAVAIGVEEGDEPYVFHRIGGGIRLANGDIVVTNGGSSEIRFFDSTGQFLRHAGHRGGGPREFHEFSTLPLWRKGDGLAVYDAGNSRVSLWDTAGRFRQSILLQGTAALPRVFLAGPSVPDGWLGFAFDGGGALRGDPGTIIRPRRIYLRLDDSGRAGRPIRTMDDRPRFVHQYQDIIHFPYLPLTAEPLATTGRDAHLALADRAELETWDRTGRLIALARWSAPPPPVAAEIYQRYRESELADMDGEQRRRYAHYFEEDLPLPNRVPAYDLILPDREGGIWLRRYRLPWEPDPQWDVLDTTGRWLGTVGTPRNASILEIGADYVLARHRDSLSIERVHLYRLIRGDAANH